MGGTANAYRGVAMNVLIALDDSPVSARAARAAVGLFAGRPDTEFLVINVSSVPTMWTGAAGFGTVGPLMMDPCWLDQTVREDGEDERELLSEAYAAGVPSPHAVVRTGDPVSEICAAANEHHADVIVVGSHDKSALRRLFDPSVAGGVVRATSLPVVVVSGDPPAGTAG